MRIDLAFYQLDLGLGTALPEFLGFFPLPAVFPEKEMDGIKQMKKQIDQTAIDNIQFIRIQVFFPAVIMYNSAEKENGADGGQQRYPVSGNEEESQETQFGFGCQEFFFEPGFDQPVPFPGEQSDGEDGQCRIVPFYFNPEIMIHIADHCIKKSIQGQQQYKQVSVTVTEHYLKIKAALFQVC